MKTAFHYFYHDMRLTWREPSTRTFMAMPLVFLAGLVWGTPALIAAFPVVQDYAPLLLEGIVLQGGLMFGMVSGMLLLDDMDLDLITVYRVAPISFGKLLLLKMAFPFLATLAFAWTGLAINPLVQLDAAEVLVTGFHFSLITPLIALTVAALAGNKIEGLTWFKFVDLVMIAPFLGFFISHPWDRIFWLFPTHWAFDAIVSQHVGRPSSMIWDHFIGISVIAAWLTLAVWAFRRKVS